jgi:segregation and condensation protein A
MAYRIKLDIFEGPFDLLLFLIKKNEVDIYDIPIHEIAAQFLEYVELMKMLDLEIAGEFIEMVAILMNIKARMLLPLPAGISDEEIEDPRTELVERLIEYQRFKLAAGDMGELEEKKRQLFHHQYFLVLGIKEEISNEEFLQDVTLFDLLLAFKKALDNMPKVTYHEVRRIEVTIEQQTQFILNKLGQKTMVLFSELVGSIKERIIIIVTFVAILEMIKARRIQVSQSELFEDIRIKLWSE